jgi:hypothetical protein
LRKQRVIRDKVLVRVAIAAGCGRYATPATIALPKRKPDTKKPRNFVRGFLQVLRCA